MSMVQALRVLVQARLQIARNTFWRGALRRKIGLIVLAFVLAFGAYGVYWLIRAGVRYIHSPAFSRQLERAAQDVPTIPRDVGPYLLMIPSLALFAALVLLVLISFSTVLTSLYLSGDTDMLLVAPVPMRAVFVVKFFGGLVVPYLLLFFLLGPVLLGYGQGMGFGVPFFVAAIGVLGLLPLLPTGLGALLVMGVVRVIPARRAREIVGVIGGLFGASWYVVNQFAPQIAPRIASVRTLNSLRQLDLPLFPSAWAGRALVAAGQRDWLTLLVYGGLFVGLSIVVFGGCLVASERLYYAGWSNVATQGGRVKQRRRTASGEQLSVVMRFASALLPQQSTAVFMKDLRVFPRDLGNVQQLIFPLALAGLWTFQLLRGGPAPSGPGGGFRQSVTMIGPAGISFFICLTLSNALGGPGISREGRGFWLLRVAPISGLRVLLGKLALSYLPFPLVGTVFTAVISVLQQSTLSAFLRSLALVWLLGLGTSCISLSLGAIFPRLNWENPRQQMSFRAGCLGPLCYVLYISLAGGLVFGVPFLGMLLPNLTIILTIVGWVLAIGLTGLVVWVSLAFGAARLDQIELP